MGLAVCTALLLAGAAAVRAQGTAQPAANQNQPGGDPKAQAAAAAKAKADLADAAAAKAKADADAAATAAAKAKTAADAAATVAATTKTESDTAGAAKAKADAEAATTTAAIAKTNADAIAADATTARAEANIAAIAAANARVAADAALAARQSSDAGGSTDTNEPDLTVKTECVLVSDSGLLGTLIRDSPKNDASVITGTGASDKCSILEGRQGTLNGTGDLTIAVNRVSLQAFVDAKKNEPGQLVLFLNGVELLTDGRLIGSEQNATMTALRFRISQGKESQLLWSMLYADGALYEARPLRAALGWKAASAARSSIIPTRPEITANVQATTVLQLWLAVLLVALTVGAVFYTATNNDALRDAKLPAWWHDALKLRRETARKPLADREQYIAGLFPLVPRTPADLTAYQTLAENALAGQLVAPADVQTTSIGLALRPKARWKPPRATYSLSRTQLALWFTFTVAAGLFLWMLYGDLRRIDGSLLGLLGISGATAGFSWIADRNGPDRPYVPSQSFLHDLMTDFDERQQMYRYQAVIVNLLLLVVGVIHVVEQLSYPVFDGSWLIFLGISGAIYGTGKGTNET
ncbi:hypothetical protein [Pseudoduganella lutea]|nr:hypothetical protein [Pseudoduganella lutea]